MNQPVDTTEDKEAGPTGRQGFSKSLLIIVLLVIVVAVAGYFMFVQKSAEPTELVEPTESVGSTSQLLIGDNEMPLSRESVDGEVLYAMLHFDNGDGVFNPAEDSPIIDDQGNIILMRFQVSESATEPDAISL